MTVRAVSRKTLSTVLLMSAIMLFSGIQLSSLETIAGWGNQALPIQTSSLLEGGRIDVYTQYSAPYGGQGLNQPSDMFWPQKEVTLCSNVTYNGFPIQDKLVGLEITDPHGNIFRKFSNETNATGLATVTFMLPWPLANPDTMFGVWHVIATVDIASIVLNDTLDFIYNFQCRLFKVSVIPPPCTTELNFAHSDIVTVAIFYGTHMQRFLPALFSSVLMDELNTPVSTATFRGSIGGATFSDYENKTLKLSVSIPTFAVPGYAKIHVNVFDKDPFEGGTPYCPEHTPTPEIFITPTYNDPIIVPDEYPTIQEAVNHANYGKTIYVREGRYSENIIVNKTVAIVGDSSTGTIIDGEKLGNVITVRAGNVWIKNLGISNSISGGAGIFIASFNGVHVEDCIIVNNAYGVWLDHCSGTFIHNSFVDNTDQAHTFESNALWDDGYPSGGNYWSDYSGTDLYTGQNQNLVGIDGIGDVPYFIDAYNLDHYPLMLPTIPDDIAVKSISVPSKVVGQGYNVSLSITVANQGIVAEEVEVAVYASENRNPKCFCLIESKTLTLEGSSIFTAVFTWYTEAFDVGNYTLHALVLPIQGETDTNDNNLSKRTISIETWHDLAITKISSKTIVGAGYCANVVVWVENRGTFLESSNVTLFCNNSAIILPDGKYSIVVTLIRGSSVRLSVTWNTSGLVMGKYSIKAVVDSLPAERNSTDNELACGIVRVGIPGDVREQFGFVDMKDISYVARHFGKDPTWDPNADINNDNKIDMKDVSIAASNFGKTYL